VGGPSHLAAVLPASCSTGLIPKAENRLKPMTSGPASRGLSPDGYGLIRIIGVLAVDILSRARIIFNAAHSVWFNRKACLVPPNSHWPWFEKDRYG
jgi:hypothetical protein